MYSQIGGRVSVDINFQIWKLFLSYDGRNFDQAIFCLYWRLEFLQHYTAKTMFTGGNGV